MSRCVESRALRALSLQFGAAGGEITAQRARARPGPLCTSCATGLYRRLHRSASGLWTSSTPAQIPPRAVAAESALHTDFPYGGVLPKLRLARGRSL